MTRMRHARKRRHTRDVLRRLAGATTAVVLALGGMVVTESVAPTPAFGVNGEACYSLADDTQALSDALKALEPTGTATDDWGTSAVVLTGTGTARPQVFSVNADMLNGDGGLIITTVEIDAPIVINVFGTVANGLSILFESFTVNGEPIASRENWEPAGRRLLWNFVDETDITFHSGRFLGSIIAEDALLTFEKLGDVNNPVLYGQIYGAKPVSPWMSEQLWSGADPTTERVCTEGADTEPAPTLTPSASRVAPDTAFVISGTGFAADQDVTLTVDPTVTTESPITTQVGSDGTFTAYLKTSANATVGTEFTITATQEDPSVSAQVTVRVISAVPVITANPTTVAQGDVFTLSGEGFTPEATVTVAPETIFKVSVAVSTDAVGTFTLMVTVADDAPQGQQTVSVRAGDNTSEITLTVTESTATADRAALVEAIRVAEAAVAAAQTETSTSTWAATIASALAAVESALSTAPDPESAPIAEVRAATTTLTDATQILTGAMASARAEDVASLTAALAEAEATLHAAGQIEVDAWSDAIRAASNDLTAAVQAAPEPESDAPSAELRAATDAIATQVERLKAITAAATAYNAEQMTLHSPTSPVSPGATVEVPGSGFAPGTVTFTLVPTTGSDTSSWDVTADELGALAATVTIPETAQQGQSWTLTAIQNGSSTSLDLIVTNAFIIFDAGPPLTPGDTVRVSWGGLDASGVEVVISALPDGGGERVHLLAETVGSTASGTAEVTIPDDRLQGEGSWTLTITARQGAVSTTAHPSVRNDFSGYWRAHDTGTVLLAYRNEIGGPSDLWDKLQQALNWNDFTYDTTDRTQARGKRGEAQIRAAIVAVLQVVFKDAFDSADDAVDAYARAAAENAGLAALLAGAEHDAVVRALSAVRDQTTTTAVTVAETDFDSWSHLQDPFSGNGNVSVIPDPTGREGNVLQTIRRENYTGIEFDADLFTYRESCLFTADVYYLEGTAESLAVQFWTNGPKYYDIGQTQVQKGAWTTIQGTWDFPAAESKTIRLTAGKYGDGNEYTFLADNVSVVCQRETPVVADDPSPELLDAVGTLRAAIDALYAALAGFADGQVPWAPPSGLEPGWITGNPMFTDDGIARFIGGNLYIRGNSAELEGMTVVAGDLDLNKSGRTDTNTNWADFNFGNVTIGSHIVPSVKKPLVVCGTVLQYDDRVGTPLFPGGGGVSDSGDEECKNEDLTRKAIEALSEALAERSSAQAATTPVGKTITFDAADAQVDADGLYVFKVNGATLAGIDTINFRGLTTPNPNRAGYILDMKPVVINVTGAGQVTIPIEHILVDGYVYSENNFWHDNLGIVAGAVMWNFPEAEDGNTEILGPAPVNPAVSEKPGPPAVSITSEALGLNFLGSILVPKGSLSTLNVSLNGRQYLGGSFIMNDTRTYRCDDKVEGTWNSEGYPFNGGTVACDAAGNPIPPQNSLLGHAEGHNYPWWFNPWTAAPSGEVRISKTVADFAAVDEQIQGSSLSDLYAVGELRCMHIENISRYQIDVKSDEWWTEHSGALLVNATWWVQVGENGTDTGVTLNNVPYGAYCTITERAGLYEAPPGVSGDGMFGLLREGQTPSGDEDQTPSGYGSVPLNAFTEVPDFGEPVVVSDGWAWAVPRYQFDAINRTVFVTDEGPTASFLLTTETKDSTAQVTNSLARVGRAAITKHVDESVGSLVQAAGPFEFAWSAPLDGYVKGPDGAMHLIAGSHTDELSLMAGQEARPQYCPRTSVTNDVPSWWPNDTGEHTGWWNAGTPVCQDLWFPEGTSLTWTEITDAIWLGDSLAAGEWYEGSGWYEWVPTFEPRATVEIPDDQGTVVSAATNHLVKAPLRFTVSKKVEGTGAASVPSGTRYTVTYQAYDDGDNLLNGECQAPDPECTLTLRADGTAVSSAGWPEGTRIVLDEATPPDVAGITWGTPRFASETTELGDNSFVLTGERLTEQIVLTNTAVAQPKFSLYKALSDADKLELAGDVSERKFTLTYTMADGHSGTRTVLSRNGNDSERQTISDVEIGDIVTVSEDTSNLDSRWKPDLMTVTFWAGDTQLVTCEDRGFDPGTTDCAPNSFQVTAENSNLVTVRVTNASRAEPRPPVTMPMTGGALAAWLAVVAGLGLGGYLSFRRGTTVRHATTQGGAMR